MLRKDSSKPKRERLPLMAKLLADLKNKNTFALKTASSKKSDVRGVSAEQDAIEIEPNNIIKVSKVVEDFVKNDTIEKVAKKDKDTAADLIRTYASELRARCASVGNYYASLQIQGEKVRGLQYAVNASAIDKFSAFSSSEDVKALQDEIGKDTFDSCFEKESTISIKKSVIEDASKRKELSRKLYEALGAEGIKEYFDKDDVWVSKDGLAKKFCTMKDETKEAILKYTKPSKDAIKNTSETIAS